MKGNVKSHFLDSGAFSLLSVSEKYQKEHNSNDRWLYFKTKQFKKELDKYAKFVKKYKIAIDYYANLDVIGNPDLTWRNQQYLEKKGLKPIPVVHFKTDTKWLEHYIDRGYDYIGLGGLVGQTSQGICFPWLDRCFNIICDTEDRFPKVKIHGFGISAFSLLIKYPWYSVDSTNWFRVGVFGSILIPYHKGKINFGEEPKKVVVSDQTDKERAFEHMPPSKQKMIMKWLDIIGIPLGKNDKKGEVVEEGIINSYVMRTKANLLYFEELQKRLPPYPQPFFDKEGGFF